MKTYIAIIFLWCTLMMSHGCKTIDKSLDNTGDVIDITGDIIDIIE